MTAVASIIVNFLVDISMLLCALSICWFVSFGYRENHWTTRENKYRKLGYRCFAHAAKICDGFVMPPSSGSLIFLHNTNYVHIFVFSPV